ncbi:uncharacterized protein LOC129975364 [Argiope bruennichi]|uniref:uncharacterized protein LOC129975364 n=1 Tax=Argiope bruennichi TaxID=94029 RepID=UPI00249436DE|nr:uncharacterized protein LOC129975364 [Argiope bruennichi]
MRVLLTGDISTKQFAQNLLHLGNGTMTVDSEGLIALTNIGNIVATIEDLQDRVFLNIESNFCDINWLCERAILSPTNEGVKTINYYLLRKLPGEIQIFKSFDTVIEIYQADPTEFLNSLEPSGIPTHKLELKIGAPIMLLRNLDPPALCNGTTYCEEIDAKCY